MADIRKPATAQDPDPGSPKPRLPHQPGPTGQSPTGSNLTAPGGKTRSVPGVVDRSGIQAPPPKTRKPG